MPFPELDSFRKKHPQFSDLIPHLQDYLAREWERTVEQLSNPNLPIHDIRPAHLAKKLSIDEGIAITLLMFSDDVGLVEPHYKVYCPDTDNFLGEYDSLESIPAVVKCPYHESGEVSHDIDQCLLELVFHFTDKVLGLRTQAIAV